MKIDLITGFLGAGKTTWIRRYAEYLIGKGEKICILENDYGAVNVDMMFLQDLLLLTYRYLFYLTLLELKQHWTYRD